MVNLATFGLKPYNAKESTNAVPEVNVAETSESSGARVQDGAADEAVPTGAAVVPAPTQALKLGGLRLGIAPSRDMVALPTGVSESPSGGGVVTTTESTAVAVGDSDTALDGAKSFQAKLDEFDALVIAGQGISQLSLDAARGYVGSIMMELKANPEYDTLLVDRDVHNVMTFIQTSTSYSATDFKKKKEVAAAKKAKAGQTAFDLSGLGNIAIPGPKSATDKVVAKHGLPGLAKLNSDLVATKLTPGRSDKK